MSKRILLSGVFGPFGVDDEFGRKENVMELFHNQVTKAQGVASLRFHHRSFGLYFLAENIKAPVTVLDFPSRKRFIEELRSTRYDAIGISFIAPNLVKAQEMARLIRAIQPHAEIILGGHGAAIDDVERLVACDHVVRGEGLKWLRRYLNEDEDAPIRHPAVVSAVHKRLYGIPTPGAAGLLIPGVGCPNACRFCATTHFFGNYTPYFATGESLYREACRLGDILKTDEFFVMDENFLKDTTRARELLACMERDNRRFRFMVFSSAEAITAFGVENLARLGVTFLWIGAESKHETYAKNAGTDLGSLVKELRDHGIFVLVSGILFLEHHTPENIWEDIQFIIGLEGTYTQFMQFTPLPQTRLYQEYKEKGLIDFDLPYEEWHGQKLLNYRHEHFTRQQANELIDQAFVAEFDQLSSSAYRMLDSALRGYQTLSRIAKTDPWMAHRAEEMRLSARDMRLLIPTMRRFAHNELERKRVDAIDKRATLELGPMTLKEKGMALAGRAIAEAYAMRCRLFGDMVQPATNLERFRWTEATRVDPVALPAKSHRRLELLPNMPETFGI
jgi:radical SAM superfamily enzyme YgiQ (UPF0313 family)